MKKIILSVIFLLCPSLLPATELVTFADKRLKTYIENKLGVIDPTVAQMARFTELEINRQFNELSELSDLTGLEYAINLRKFEILTSKISDISVLSKLSHLESIGIYNSPVSDISAISKLQKLKILRLNGCNVTELSPLTELRNLTCLELHGNGIEDVSELAHIKSLSWLGLSNNKITNISHLSELYNLSNLGLRNNDIEDVSCLADMKSLISFDLSNNKISDISSLSHLHGLLIINLTDNDIEDISSIAGMLSLKILYLSENKVKDLSSLSKLRELEVLRIEDNPIKFGYLNPVYISLFIHNKGLRARSALLHVLYKIIGVVCFIVFCAILIRLRKHLARGAIALFCWFKHNGCKKCTFLIRFRKYLARGAIAIFRWFKRSGCEKCAFISPVLSTACLCFGLFCMNRLYGSRHAYEGIVWGFLIMIIYPISSGCCGLIAVLGLFGKHKKKRIALVSLAVDILLPILLIALLYLCSYLIRKGA